MNIDICIHIYMYVLFCDTATVFCHFFRTGLEIIYLNLIIMCSYMYVMHTCKEI